MQVVFQHVFYTLTGFGTAAREIAFAMDDLGVDVKLDVVNGRSRRLSPATVERLQRLEQKPSSSDRILLTIHGLTASREYRKTVSCLMFETSKAPASYVSAINRFNGLIVPCELNRQMFRNGGVTIPIYVVPYGVDTQLFNPEGPARELGRGEGDYVFLSVFGWSARKGPDILIQAFLREFTADDHVRLVIKTHDGSLLNLPRDWYERVAAGVPSPRPPRVEILTEDLTPEEIAMLYRSADCYVMPSRGEAIGLPYLESMASGLPVIATGWGGQIEFLGPESGYLVPFQLVPAHPDQTSNLYQPDQLWAEVDEGALRAVMRRVYVMPEEGRAKGRAGRQVAEQWNWQRSGAGFVKALESIAGQSLR